MSHASSDLKTVNHFKAHPWHGIPIGDQAPAVVNCYIEIVPSDGVKYEIDKNTGHLKVDRPQLYSNKSPALYGFVPQTYCGARVGAYCSSKASLQNIQGDGDPIDICVLTEREFQHGDLFLRAIPIGGLRMIDRNQADDKIIAVLRDDAVYGGIKDIVECPAPILDRLRHYFLTYKDIPGEKTPKMDCAGVYGAIEAREVIAASREDYLERFR